MEKRGRGRPPSDNPRRFVRSVHFAEDELRTVEDAAADSGQPVTAFIRDAALDAAQPKRRRRR